MELPLTPRLKHHENTRKYHGINSWWSGPNNHIWSCFTTQMKPTRTVFPFSCHGHVCEDGHVWRFGFKSNDFYAPVSSLVSFFNSFPFGETLRYPSNLLVILILSIFYIKSMLKPFLFRSHQEDFPTWIANEKGIKNEEVLFPELPTLKPLLSKS